MSGKPKIRVLIYTDDISNMTPSTTEVRAALEGLGCDVGVISVRNSQHFRHELALVTTPPGVEGNQ